MFIHIYTIKHVYVYISVRIYMFIIDIYTCNALNNSTF